MHYRRHGLKALGLSLLAVVGLMGFATSGAWGSGKVLVEGLAAPFTAGFTAEADTLTSNDRVWILGFNLEISCPTVDVTNGLLTSAGHGSATLLFLGCTGQGVNAAGALVGAPCKPTPEDMTAKILALIILHSGNAALTTAQHGSGTGNPYVLFTPLDGLTFATVTNSDEECLLPEKLDVKGCVVAKFHTTGDQVVHLIDTRGMLELFGCALKFGTNVAHMEVDALVRLTDSSHGSHAGLKWGVE